MSKPLVSDELWNTIAPLLPPEPPKPKGGRPRVPDRAALTGIVFVLRSGIPWDLLPHEMAVAAGSPAGAGCATGSAPGCGTACTKRCWIVSAPRASSIGRARARTAGASRPKRGRGDRAEPDGSRQARQQAPRPGRAARHPTGGRTHGRQRAGRVPLHDAGRCGNADSPAPRPLPPPPREVPRRQGVGQRPVPGRVAAPWDRAPHRPQRRRVERPSGAVPMGGGAHPRLVGPVPPVGDPLRTVAGDSRRVPLSRLFAHLSQLPLHELLKGALIWMAISRHGG